MSYRLVLIDENGIEFDEMPSSKRTAAIKTANNIVNNNIAFKVKVYSSYTMIYTAVLPETPIQIGGLHEA